MTGSMRAWVAFGLAAGMAAGGLLAQDSGEGDFRAATDGRGMDNWAAPLYWSSGAGMPIDPERGDGPRVREKGAPVTSTSPLPLIGITPCRLVDTRDAGRPAGYGPPHLSAGVPRSFVLVGRCGIAGGAQAVSLNVTVVSPAGVGYVLLYPQGAPQPVVSTLNFTAGQTVANAAIVPLGPGGGITVAAALSNTELLIDTNGYYAAAGVGTENTFLGFEAGNFAMTGDFNTGIGSGTLTSNTTGQSSTAIGFGALVMNTTGFENTAVGAAALDRNTTGNFNTGSGAQALFLNRTGDRNSASGYGALGTNDSGSGNTAGGYTALGSNFSGNFNTAEGQSALFTNTTGSYNTASGLNALYSNDTGVSNTALGISALYFNATGSANIALGANAGINLTAGDNNLYLDSPGVASESATIRIGRAMHTRAFLSGTRGTTTGVGDGVPILIDSSGQLGTTNSSARTKEEVADMAQASSGLLRLRPVTFRYRGQADGRKQFGLIAEEVEEVLPELVVRNPAGEVETVMYHEMPAMLLNEIQKQQKTIDAQATAIARQGEEAAAQRRQIGELLARLEAIEAVAGVEAPQH